MASGPILRVFRVTPTPGAEAALVEKLRGESTRLVRDQPGCIGWVAAGPSQDGVDRHLVFITFWESMEAVVDFAGHDVTQSVLPDGYAELIDSHSVEHLPIHANGTPAR